MKTCDKCGSNDFTKAGRCKPCRKIYMQKFRIENADTIKDSKRAWNLLNIEKIKLQTAERCKRWLVANPEKAKRNAEKWARENPEKAAAVKRDWVNAHRKEHNSNVSAWAKRNRPACRINWLNYKSRKLSAGGSFTKEDVTALFIASIK